MHPRYRFDTRVVFTSRRCAVKMVAVLPSIERFIDTNGVRLRVLEAGDRGALLAQAGFHVLAPD